MRSQNDRTDGDGVRDRSGEPLAAKATWWLAALLLSLCPMWGHAADDAKADDAKEPVKLAGECRLDIQAEAAVSSLSQGELIAGAGRIERMNWKPAAEQGLGYVVMAPITHYGTKSAAVRFTAAKPGEVIISLAGPWEEARPGVLFKQEIEWEQVKVENARVLGDDPKFPLMSWHNGRQNIRLRVFGGRTVTVRWSAKAVKPDGFVEPKRYPPMGTAAHQAMVQFRQGINFGNGFEAPPDQNWGMTYTRDDVQAAKKEGFDHIRVPIGWHHYTGPAPDFTIQPEFFTKVDALLDEIIDAKLGLLINIHHFDEFTTDPAAHTDRLLAIWKQLAAHYREAPPSVAFELLNEPKDAATTAVLNPIYAELIGIIRESNPQRTIFVGPGRFNSVSELPSLVLPDDDNLVVTVHTYDPFYFTHQGATWSGPDVVKLAGIQFPGPPTKPAAIPDDAPPHVKDWLQRYNRNPSESNPCSPAQIRALVEQARSWSEYYGRPVHFGEFGAYDRADVQSRANYVKAFRDAISPTGMGWAMWDWKAGFKYWDAERNAAIPQMRAALFGRP
jgi:endoglucanase